ncbi:MAG TPA: response regulator [Terriglobia bacterium]|nr:response regulator [Terriglobia bacterium]
MNQPKTDFGIGVEILVAEDSPTQAEQLKHYLTARGYTVTVVGNGKQALAAALERKPRLVITDIVMPEMDGYDLCKEIKSQAGLADVPVILLTSLSTAHDVLKGLECGADNFIRKPYDEKYLLSRVEYILANQELRKSERMRVGVHLYFAGQTYFITSERHQILDLLISTYEEAVRINEDLETKQRELSREHDLLRERTSQLAEANKQLEAFSYSVAHDLRAPLRQINGFVSVLIDDFASQLGPAAERHLQTIREGSEKMGRMVDDLLNLARLDRKEMELKITPLNSTVNVVLTELQAQCANRKIEWDIGSLPSVACDPGLMKLAFTNLLSNAVKYTLRKDLAVIQVGQVLLDGHVTLFVRDNGAGFNLQHASKLFGVFQRFHAADEFEGSGVGLATVQRIIRKHGGRIWAEAEPGKGATFYFTLGRIFPLP